MTPEAVLQAFRDRGWMLATAESCTGGMIAAALTDIAGSSDVVDRGFVTYSNAAKVEMLGVRETTLSSFGAVSDETAREMADGALSRSAAEVTVAVTGIAGPGGSDHKPEGRVWFALARKGHKTETVKREFGPVGRAQVRDETVKVALSLLHSAAISEPN